MTTWTEQPTPGDIEAVVRHYFHLLRTGRIPDVEQFVDDHPTRHVLTALWTATHTDDSPTAGRWGQDLSWLGELHLAAFRWGHTTSHVSIEITHGARTLDVALGFWIKPTDTGWTLTGPATYW
ncbi:hypothetical protein ACFXAF_14850 [Kitasatospora sp. NPDC059463]|uniref:hypothetical protein n=1 Tax=unclassified Kitasatospora TaxID=2633591 RepID=UPI0036C3568D